MLQKPNSLLERYPRIPLSFLSALNSLSLATNLRPAPYRSREERNVTSPSSKRIVPSDCFRSGLQNTSYTEQWIESLHYLPLLRCRSHPRVYIYRHLKFRIKPGAVAGGICTDVSALNPHFVAQPDTAEAEDRKLVGRFAEQDVSSQQAAAFRLPALCGIFNVGFFVLILVIGNGNICITRGGFGQTGSTGRQASPNLPDLCYHSLWGSGSSTHLPDFLSQEPRIF